MVKIFVRYCLVLALLLQARAAFSADLGRQQLVEQIASILKTQVDEAISGSFSECRQKLDHDGLLNSYRVRKCVDLSFQISTPIMEVLTTTCASNLGSYLLCSNLSVEQLKELNDGLTSKSYLVYHIEVVKLIKLAISGAQLLASDAIALTDEQAELADALFLIPGAQETDQAKQFNRNIASKIDDAEDAKAIISLIKSEAFQVALKKWSEILQTLQH